MPHAFPATEPARTRALLAYGDFAVQAVRLWQMIRRPEIPPLGGEVLWRVDWGAFGEAYRAELPLLEGFERAEFFEAMLTLQQLEHEDAAETLAHAG